MAQKNVLFLNGIGDDRKIRLIEVRKDGSTVLKQIGSTDIYEDIRSDQFSKTFLLLDTNPSQEIKEIRFNAVFNQISNPDTYKKVLTKVEGIQKGLHPKVPFFNIPSNVKKTTRDNTYRLLQGIDKLHIPKTVRIQPSSPSDIYDTIDKEHFEFPVIFRQASDHNSMSTILLEDTTEQFYTFPLDGRDYYLTQFVDYLHNGLYEKVQLMVIDGNVYTVGTMISDQWLVDAKNELFDTNAMRMRKNSLKSFTSNIEPIIQPVITEIYKKLNLDCFGIDCHIDNDGNIVVFDIYAGMGELTSSPKKKRLLKPYIKKINQAFIKMIMDRI